LLSNCRSLLNKFDDLTAVVSTISNIQIIACTETWLTNEAEDAVIQIPGYTLYRCDRLNRVGGGVCVWIETVLQSYSCPVCVNNYRFHEGIESVWLVIAKYKILFVCIYIPPKISVDNDAIQAFIATTDLLQNKYPSYNWVITGDYNQMNLNYFCANFNLIATVNIPTRGDAILDNILISKPLIVCVESVSTLPPLSALSADSDHLTVHLKSVSVFTKEEHRTVKCYDYRESSIGDALFYLHNINLSNFYSVENVNEKLQILMYHIQCAIDMIPFELVTFTEKTKPWITTKVKMWINKRWGAWRKQDMNRYNYYKKKVKDAIRESKQKWADKCCKTGKGAWSVVDEILNRHSKEDFVKLLTINNTIESVLDDVTNVFQQTFNCHDRNQVILPEDDGQDFANITVDKLLAEIMKSKSCKAVGSDGLSYRLLKIFAPYIVQPLCSVMSDSIRSRTVPDLWKISDIVPIPKVKFPNCSQLRPLSILPNASSLMEKIIQKEVGAELRVHYGKNQHAYNNNTSTCTALVQLHYTVNKMRDMLSTKCVRIVFFDLSSAFQKVRHDLLLQRLINCGISPGYIHWLQSYLRDRTMRVRLNGKFGRSVSVPSSVMQGSSVGPTLFAVFLGSLNLANFDGSNYEVIIYADDIIVIERMTSCDLKKHYSHVNDIIRGCEVLDLDLNYTKLKQLFVVSARDFVVPDFYQGIEVISSYKYLGIICNSEFDLSLHIEDCIARASQRLFIIRTVKNILPKKSLVVICKSLVLSRAFYAAPLLFSANVTQKNNMQKFVNRCHVILCGKDCNDQCLGHVNDYILRASTKLFQNCQSTNHILHSYVPHRLPRTNQFAIPYCRTTRLLNTFFVGMALHCNSL
jgi:hypothetical protein